MRIPAGRSLARSVDDSTPSKSTLRPSARGPGTGRAPARGGGEGQMPRGISSVITVPGKRRAFIACARVLRQATEALGRPRPV